MTLGSMKKTKSESNTKSDEFKRFENFTQRIIAVPKHEIGKEKAKLRHATATAIDARIFGEPFMSYLRVISCSYVAAKAPACSGHKQSPRSGRQTFPRNRLHHGAEAIQLAERGVDIWRYPEALKLFMNDRCREDSMFVEQITADRARIHAFDLYVGNSTRLPGIE